MSVAQILEKLAENAGRRALLRGQVIGDTVAAASQVPGQMIQDRERKAIVDREQARRDTEVSLRQNEDARAAAGEQRTATAYLQNQEKEQVLRGVIAAGFQNDPNNFDDKAAIAAAQQSKYPELVGTVQDIHAKLAKPVTPITVIPRGGTGVQQNPDGTVKTVVQGAPPPMTATDIENEMINIGRKPPEQRTPDEAGRYDEYMRMKAPPSQTSNMRVSFANGTTKDVPVTIVPSRDGKNARHYYNGEDVTGRTSVIPPVAVQINTGTQAAANNFKPITSRPDPTLPESNKIDPVTGLTPQSQWQLGGTFALTRSQPPAGLGSSVRANAKRAAIEAQGAAMAAAAGTDMSTLQAEYRAKSNELSNITPTFDRIATAANTGKDFLDLADQASEKIDRTQSKFVNKYVQLAEKNFTNTAGLSQFELYVYSAAREYARVTTGAGASNAELTKAAAEKADALLNASQSKDTFRAVAQGMQNDMDRVVSQQQKTLANVSSTIANFLSVQHGLPTVTGGTSTPPPATVAPPATLPPPAAGRVRIVNIADPKQSGTILATDAVPAGWRKQ